MIQLASHRRVLASEIVDICFELLAPRWRDREIERLAFEVDEVSRKHLRLHANQLDGYPARCRADRAQFHKQGRTPLIDMLSSTA